MKLTNYSRSSNDIYVTRDGANSWQKVSIEPPKEEYSPDGSSSPPANDSCTTEQYPTGKMSYHPPVTIYELPTFTDSEHGFLPATYSAPLWAKYSSGCKCRTFHVRAVLFATSDGGRSWKPDRMLFSCPEAHPACISCTVLSAVEGSTWILVNHSNTDFPSFSTLATGARVDISQGDAQTANTSDSGNGVFWEVTRNQAGTLDLATPSMGWIMWNGELLSTTNGGGTLTEITPKSNQPLASDAAP